MNKSNISWLIIAFLFLIILSDRVYPQNAISHPIRLMFYNAENLFDIYDDTLKEDNEFLPGGTKRWNLTRYNRKIDLLYKTIVAAGGWDTPVIVAFSEIENRKVLEDLVSGTYLSKFKYRIVHEDSPDQRGIDVCLIYRKDCAEVIDYRYWIPSYVNREDFHSRSILYVKFLISTDTIHLIVNHWPSRRGGVLAGEGLRVNIASMVREKADSIIRSSPADAKIIILGDFNSTPDDREINSLILPSDSGIILKNLSEYLSDKGLGTYRYKGTWELIDQIIVSEKLITCKNGLYTGSEMVTIFKPGFLLKKDPKYPGFSPYSTYHGYRYQGGYSDHLPVMLDLKFRQQDQQE